MRVSSSSADAVEPAAPKPQGSRPAPALALLPWLLAQAAAPATDAPAKTTGGVDIRQISEHWGSGGWVSTRWAMVAIGALLVLLAIIAMTRWWRTRHLRSNPLLVFNQVAAELELPLRQRWLLFRIARQQALPSPLTLLLSPRTMRLHARAYAADKRVGRRLQIMQRVAQMRRQLYD